MQFTAGMANRICAYLGRRKGMETARFGENPVTIGLCQMLLDFGADKAHCALS
jgi:hypothetical protein